mmetsp:Transcript_127979/g.272915  ORF Transcript_127979/g.272915 Transcript_127979/m.272915 type:complete len:209 (-) Transcript_127979:553-1179(-)
MRILHLKARTLEMRRNPAKRRRRVGARKHMLFHEKAPNQLIVIVVAGSCVATLQTRALDVERAFILQKGNDLLQEDVEVGDSSVLGHLNGADHIEALLGEFDIVEVLCDEFHPLTMMLVQTMRIVGQVMSHYNASDLSPLLRKVFSEAAPTRADIKSLHAWLHAQRVGDVLHLPELGRVEGLCVDEVVWIASLQWLVAVSKLFQEEAA